MRIIFINDQSITCQVLRKNMSKLSDFSFLNVNICWFPSFSVSKLNIFGLWTKQEV